MEHRPKAGNFFEVIDIVNIIITFSDCEFAGQNLQFKDQSLFSKRFTAIPAKLRCYTLYHYCRLHISFQQVACSLMTTVFWRQVQPYFHLELYGSITSPPGVEESSDFRSRDDLVDPRDYPKWAPPRFALLPYLDENRDGKVTIQEFYDLKFVKIMRHVFDGLDADGDGVVQKDEANLMSFLRVSPVRKFSRELFDLMDINNDGYISRDDSRHLEGQDDLGGGRWEGSVCQFLPSWIHRPCNSLIYTGPPTYYNPLIDK